MIFQCLHEERIKSGLKTIQRIMCELNKFPNINKKIQDLPNSTIFIGIYNFSCDFQFIFSEVIFIAIFKDLSFFEFVN